MTIYRPAASKFNSVQAARFLVDETFGDPAEVAEKNHGVVELSAAYRRRHKNNGVRPAT